MNLYNYSDLSAVLTLLYDKDATAPILVASTNVVTQYNKVSNQAETYGEFEFVDIIAGTYLLEIDRPGYVPYFIKVEITDSSKDLGIWELVPGDVDRDGTITSTDYSICARYIGAIVGSGMYAGKYDITGSGSISSTTVAWLARYIGFNFTLYPNTGIDFD